MDELLKVMIRIAENAPAPRSLFVRGTCEQMVSMTLFAVPFEGDGIPVQTVIWAEGFWANGQKSVSLPH
jgi:hypothetical protein